MVPGVTAGLAGPAYAGIPATHRDTNQAVVLATGHSAGPGTDWQALGALAARTGTPLILYMAWRTLGAIADALAEGGLSPTTPVAVICDATTPRQRVLISTLARCAADLAASDLSPPAIIVVGTVTGLRARLAWREGDTP